MELTNGRPACTAARQAREVRVYDLLDSLGIAYATADHEPAATMDICRRIEEATGVGICKNLFLCNRRQTDFYMLLMPGSKPFKTRELSVQAGITRLSFATPDHMLAMLDTEPGAVSVFGLMNDAGCRVRLLVDRDLLSADRWGCHPCVNTSIVSIARADVLERFVPAVGHTWTPVTLLGE